LQDRIIPDINFLKIKGDKDMVKQPTEESKKGENMTYVMYVLKVDGTLLKHPYHLGTIKTTAQKISEEYFTAVNGLYGSLSAIILSDGQNCDVLTEQGWLLLNVAKDRINDMYSIPPKEKLPDANL
jgi:hypothetical protein